MENKKIISFPEFTAVVYRKYDDFLKKETKEVEFCLYVQPLHRAHTNSLFFIKVSNSILSSILSPQQLQGSAGTETYLDFNFLNKRIVEPTDNFVGAEYVFNDKKPYLHGRVETTSYTKNERNELIQFRAQLFFADIAEFTYGIR